jgi:hypothetical protein
MARLNAVAPSGERAGIAIHAQDRGGDFGAFWRTMKRQADSPFELFVGISQRPSMFGALSGVVAGAGDARWARNGYQRPSRP